MEKEKVISNCTPLLEGEMYLATKEMMGMEWAHAPIGLNPNDYFFINGLVYCMVWKLRNPQGDISIVRRPLPIRQLPSAELPE